MDLIAYIKNSYTDVRIIGKTNPSIIITVGGVSYTIYRAYVNSINKIAICIGEDRFYCTEFEEIKEIVK